MVKKSDEEILYDCYKRIESNIASRKKKAIDESKDKTLVNGIQNSLSKLLMYLDELQGLTAEELQKRIISAKGLYMQYLQVKHRHPNLVPSGMKKNIDRLIRAVCRHEAEMISMFRVCETGGERIDLEEIFSQKKYYNRLTAALAKQILLEAIGTNVKMRADSVRYYITDTGKKYHRKDCQYCKGRNLTAVSFAMVQNQKLSECKCIKDSTPSDEVDRSYVTAFVDETIHPVIYDMKGNRNGKVGSYSYILCWGNLCNEAGIIDKRIIAQGLDFIGEHEHIERITEAAIGKVMLSLIYDYDFKGPIRIFTDNMTAVNHWKEIGTNSKLAKQFEEVSVSFVSREFNTKADKLGRTRMLMDMPINRYNEINNIIKADELSKKQAKKTEKSSTKTREEENGAACVSVTTSENPVKTSFADIFKKAIMRIKSAIIGLMHSYAKEEIQVMPTIVQNTE